MGPVRLHILSPEGTVLEKDVFSVTLPGTLGSFQVLRDHAPLLSSLERGTVVYEAEDGQGRVDILSGFVRVEDNRVDVCAETVEKAEA